MNLWFIKNRNDASLRKVSEKSGSDQTDSFMFQSAHLYNKISIFGYIFLCFNFLFFGYLLATHKNYYHIFTREDSYVEYMGFLLLLLTSFLLFLSARKKPFRWLYLIFACVFAWAAAEEISWGQRIFGFKTPAFLQALNAQNELNTHNINKRFLTAFMTVHRLHCAW